MDNGVEKSEIADKVQEKEILSSERKKRQAKKATVVSGDATTTEGKGGQLWCCQPADQARSHLWQLLQVWLIISEWLYSSGSQPGASANFQRGKTIIKIS